MGRTDRPWKKTLRDQKLDNKYRGPLFIHAGSRMDSECAIGYGMNPERLPTSAFIGVVQLTDVRPFTRKDAGVLRKNRAGGGWDAGLFSWVLKKPKRISRPIRAKGKLGLIRVTRLSSASDGTLFKPSKWLTGFCGRYYKRAVLLRWSFDNIQGDGIPQWSNDVLPAVQEQM